jgi:hypothetical protein
MNPSWPGILLARGVLFTNGIFTFIAVSLYSNDQIHFIQILGPIMVLNLALLVIYMPGMSDLVVPFIPPLVKLLGFLWSMSVLRWGAFYGSRLRVSLICLCRHFSTGYAVYCWSFLRDCLFGIQGNA